MSEDPDLTELEADSAGALDPEYDDDVYDDLPASVPTAYAYHGEAVPDLDAIPQDQWKAALAPRSPWVRNLAVNTTKTHAERVAAQWVLIELQADERLHRKQALARSAPPPVPTLGPDLRPRRDTRQINFRVSPAEHSELTEVAIAYGVSAPRLARMLTIRGVRRALGQG